MCPTCRQPIASRDPRAVYCSHACRQRAYRERQHAAAEAQREALTRALEALDSAGTRSEVAAILSGALRAS